MLSNGLKDAVKYSNRKVRIPIRKVTCTATYLNSYLADEFSLSPPNVMT